MASYLFGVDFTRSVLIVTAIVNIHHFVLDGAIWKLRDGRIAALLVDSRRRAAVGAADAGQAVHQAIRWLLGDRRGARALRVAAFVMLCLWAAVDQARFVLGTSSNDLSALTRASALNPHDSSVQQRKARLLIEQHRYQDAYEEYRGYLAVHPDDADALVNVGVLAMELGREDEAAQEWQAALDIDPRKETVRRYLAQWWAARADRFDQAGGTDEAGRAFLKAVRSTNGAATGPCWVSIGPTTVNSCGDSTTSRASCWRACSKPSNCSGAGKIRDSRPCGRCEPRSNTNTPTPCRRSVGRRRRRLRPPARAISSTFGPSTLCSDVFVYNRSPT